MKPIEPKQSGLVAVDNRGSAEKTPANSAESSKISHWTPIPPALFCLPPTGTWRDDTKRTTKPYLKAGRKGREVILVTQVTRSATVVGDGTHNRPRYDAHEDFCLG